MILGRMNQHKKNDNYNMSIVDPGSIETFSGQLIDPLRPDPDTVLIEDIARSLSMQCRFNGHCTRFYSVAEHSVHCAKLAEKLFPESPEIAIFALLHDGSEAYLCDVPRPVKASFPNYLQWEAVLSDIIYRKFTGISPAEDDEKKILKVDNIMLATESFYLVSSKGEGWGVPEEVDDTLKLYCWSPEKAEQEFHKLFKKYSDKKQSRS